MSDKVEVTETEKSPEQKREEERVLARKAYKDRSMERDKARRIEAEREAKKRLENPAVAKREKERDALREKNGVRTVQEDDAILDKRIKSIRGGHLAPFPELWEFLSKAIGLDLRGKFGPITTDWSFPSGGFILGDTQVTEGDIVSLKADIERLKAQVAELSGKKK